MTVPGAEGIRPLPAGGGAAAEGVRRAARRDPGAAQASGKPAATPAEPGRFEAILRERAALRGLRWSRHAEARLRQTGVTLSDDDQAAIDEAVAALARRGTREGLVLYGDLALVVSVSGRTVITAARPQRLTDGIFTQIDGAAVIHGKYGAGPRSAAAGGEEALSPRIDGSGLTSRRSIET